jgi:ribonuclease BN (tRNA processing enzyme)
LTHLHPDHTADLVPFLFGSKYPPYLIHCSRIELVAGTDFRPFYEGLRDLYGSWIELPGDVFQVITLPENGSWEREFPGFRLISRPMVHTASSLGYRLVLPDRKILVFSGDSDYSTQLVELAQKADVLVLECSFPEGEKVAGHLTPSLAGKIARQADVKKLVLTHFYPECIGRDLLEPCAREFGGPITLAEDFLTLSI